MRLLSQVVEVAVGQLGAFGGDLHSEAGGDAVLELSVHQSEILEVSWRKDCGDLQEHKQNTINSQQKYSWRQPPHKKNLKN